MSKEYKEEKKRIIVYGPPKVWKTGSLVTIPTGCKVHVVDADRQLGTLIQEWKRRKRPMSDLDWTTIDTSSGDPTKIFEQLRDALWKCPKGYDFYVIDSYTICGLLITHECVGVGDREYNQPNNADLSAYVTDFYWQYANSVENEGAWLITIMHERRQEIDDGLSDPKDYKSKKSMIAPHVASSAAVTIPGQTPFVWHAEPARKVTKTGGTATARSVTVFRTRGTPQIMASTQGHDGVLQDTEYADFDAMLTKLGYKFTKRSKKPQPTRRRN